MSGECIYCGRPAKYYLKWKKAWCCEDRWERCPQKRKERSDRLKGRPSPMKGKKHSEKTKKKMSKKRMGYEQPEYVKKALSEFRKGKTWEELMDVEVSKRNRKKLSKWMKNGHAAHMNRFITNPSKPQVELYNMVLELCPYAILNYPCLNYSIDIAIPFLNIAIEYDEPYWHQNGEYDEKRQKDLEEEGWSFIRFESLPSKRNIRKRLLYRSL